ncbi:hypothetical protein [Segatella copri]|nr:hypothetical protein [Segatella copri]MCW4097804.1 hypothetical protein [Segatella copri]
MGPMNGAAMKPLCLAGRSKRIGSLSSALFWFSVVTERRTFS